jgi:hypothetical protein
MYVQVHKKRARFLMLNSTFEHVRPTEVEHLSGIHLFIFKCLLNTERIYLCRMDTLPGMFS